MKTKRFQPGREDNASCVGKASSYNGLQSKEAQLTHLCLQRGCHNAEQASTPEAHEQKDGEDRSGRDSGYNDDAVEDEEG